MTITSINKDFLTVTVSRYTVAEFKRQWRGSDLLTEEISFTFRRNNGDLVDIQMNQVDYDGADLLALSHDAGNFAVEQDLLPSFARK